MNPDSYSASYSICKFKNKLIFYSKDSLFITDGTKLGTQKLKYMPTLSSGSGGVEFFEFGNYLYFNAPTRFWVQSDNELWRTDGTEAGTTLVKDINVGNDGSNPKKFKTLNTTTFIFSAFSPATGTELWKSDGTASGTVLLHDVVSGIDGSNPDNLTNVGNDVFFTALTQNDGVQLWRTDGSNLYRYDKDPNYVIRDFGLDFNDATVLNNNLYYRSYDSIYKINSQSQIILPIIERQYYSNLTSFNGNLVLGLNLYSELWKYDLSNNNLTLIKNYFQIPYCYRTPASSLTKSGNKLFFSASSGSYAEELWLTDGTTNGTNLVKDINATLFCKASSPNFLTDVNGILFFVANDGINGKQLWKSDGTESGTVMVKNIFYPSSSSFTDIINLKNNAYFGVKKSNTYRFQIWKSDGTVGGTAALNSNFSDEAPSLIKMKDKIMIVNNRLSDVIDSLWVLDGASNMIPLGEFYDPQSFLDYKGFTYFTAYSVNSFGYYCLYRTNGTLNGTAQIAAIYPKYVGTTTYSSPGIFVINDTLFIRREDSYHGYYYNTGGTSVDYIASIPQNDYNARLGSIFFNGKYYKSISNPSTGDELYSSSDLINWTLVKDITPGTGSTGILGFNVLDGKISFFTNYDNLVYRTILWESDGTLIGTKIVKVINPRTNTYNRKYKNLSKIGNKLYFIIDDGIHGEEIWSSDGTTAGTNVLIDFYPGLNGGNLNTYSWVGKNLIFSGYNGGQYGLELWKIAIDCSTDYMDTAKSGNWNNTSTWSCGTLPTVTDKIIINQGHVVNLSQEVIIKDITLNGIINYLQGGKLNLGNQ